jgi:hypothetical protein
MKGRKYLIDPEHATLMIDDASRRLVVMVLVIGVIGQQHVLLPYQVVSTLLYL